MIGGRYRGVLFLVGSLLAALVVTLGIYNLIQDAQRNVTKVQGPTTRQDVIVAARDIPPGWTIKAEHLATRQLPEEFIPDEVYRSGEEIIGRVAMERVLAGEFIREERLADPEAGTGLSAIIPRGMRALQVPVKHAAAVSGFLNPHNFVDILAVCADTVPPEVRTLMQSVTVLAVDDRMTDVAYNEKGDTKRRGERRRSPSVTLALTPSDAERVKHAFASCKITLTLRNDIDVTSSETVKPVGVEATPGGASGAWTPPAQIDPERAAAPALAAQAG